MGVAINELDLAVTYLKAQQFDEAIINFKSAKEIVKSQSGDRALLVGYALAGSASAYAGKGDRATSSKLLAAAIDILGPIIGAQPQAKWL